MTAAQTLTLTDFLLARIAEDEAGARPKTVTVSGGYPAPEVPNCVGPTGSGCDIGWRLAPSPDAPTGWWKDPSAQSAMRKHELTHATPAQRRVLADVEAKRQIAAEHPPMFNPLDSETYCRMCVSETGFGTTQRNAMLGQAFPCRTLRLLALPYAYHRDYRDAWRPDGQATVQHGPTADYGDG